MIFELAPHRYLGASESELAEADSRLAWSIDHNTNEVAPLHPSASAYVTADQKLPLLLNKITKFATENDTLALYGQLQLFDSARRASSNTQESFGSTALVEFFGGIVASLNESTVRDNVGRQHDVGTFLDLDNSLREFGRAEFLTHIMKTRARHQDKYTQLRQFLQFEYRFDRMQGYGPMMRRINSAILAPLTEESYEKLGFTLRDAQVAADALIKIQSLAATAAHSRAFSRDPQGHGNEQEKLEAFFSTLRNDAPRLESDLPCMLANHTGIDLERMRGLLHALSTQVGNRNPIK